MAPTDRRRLLQAPINTREPRQENDHVVAGPLPDTDKDESRHRPLDAVHPLRTWDMEDAPDDVVDEPQVGIEQEAPHQRDSRHGDDAGEEVDGPKEADPPQFLIGQQRQAEREEHAGRHAHERVVPRIRKDLPEEWRGVQGSIVRQAQPGDVLPVSPVREADQDGGHDRTEPKEGETEDRGKQKRVAFEGFPKAAPARDRRRERAGALHARPPDLNGPHGPQHEATPRPADRGPRTASQNTPSGVTSPGGSCRWPRRPLSRQRRRASARRRPRLAYCASPSATPASAG